MSFYRNVLNAKYRKGAFNQVFYISNDKEVVDFHCQFARFAINPRDYSNPLPLPSDAEFRALQNRYRDSPPDRDLLKRLVDEFNKSQPLLALSRAKVGKISNHDEWCFSAVRYLHDEKRMSRLQDAWKAYMINKLCDYLVINTTTDIPHREYDISTFKAFSWHVKTYFLPNRSFYKPKRKEIRKNEN